MQILSLQSRENVNPSFWWLPISKSGSSFLQKILISRSRNSVINLVLLAFLMSKGISTEIFNQMWLYMKNDSNRDFTSIRAHMHLVGHYNTTRHLIEKFLTPLLEWKLEQTRLDVGFFIIWQLKCQVCKISGWKRIFGEFFIVSPCNIVTFRKNTAIFFLNRTFNFSIIKQVLNFAR